MTSSPTCRSRPQQPLPDRLRHRELATGTQGNTGGGTTTTSLDPSTSTSTSPDTGPDDTTQGVVSLSSTGDDTTTGGTTTAGGTTTTGGTSSTTIDPDTGFDTECGGGGDLEFSFIWISNSPEGTVSKIDTLSGANSGVYGRIQRVA